MIRIKSRFHIIHSLDFRFLLLSPAEWLRKATVYCGVPCPLLIIFYELGLFSSSTELNGNKLSVKWCFKSKILCGDRIESHFALARKATLKDQRVNSTAVKFHYETLNRKWIEVHYSTSSFFYYIKNLYTSPYSNKIVHLCFKQMLLLLFYNLRFQSQAYSRSSRSVVSSVIINPFFVNEKKNFQNPQSFKT